MHAIESISHLRFVSFLFISDKTRKDHVMTFGDLNFELSVKLLVIIVFIDLFLWESWFTKVKILCGRKIKSVKEFTKHVALKKYVLKISSNSKVKVFSGSRINDCMWVK